MSIADEPAIAAAVEISAGISINLLLLKKIKTSRATFLRSAMQLLGPFKGKLKPLPPPPAPDVFVHVSGV